MNGSQLVSLDNLEKKDYLHETTENYRTQHGGAIADNAADRHRLRPILGWAG
ncbi:hypothetical protein GCM10009720_06920 [Yaniella flava]|uniref:Uncharacterized protein n=1 Tax=Yaniella flava TaxID=287930 RepID=A0ABN2U654_9MICC